MAKTTESIGKYKVLKLLAQGGMGAVYTAEHPTLERIVIIKKLTMRGSADIRERFKREAQIMMDLRNDAIVDVYDHFREGSYYYIVLEYVDGFSLEELIRRRRYLPDAVALLILREAARGLAYAHERGVVHRDIKPANILISQQGEVKLVDFGIATIHDAESAPSELTREGMTLGTPSYMAPEQFQNTRAVDKRADIYSLGVVLYEMLCGKRPYPGAFTPEVVNLIQRGKYVSVRRHNPKVGYFAVRLLRRMLKPKPQGRFTELAPVIHRLNRYLGLKAHAPAHRLLRGYLDDERSFARTKLHQRGRRVSLFVAGLAVSVLLAGAVGWGVRRGVHHELFQAGYYGALEVTVRVAKDGRAPEEMAPQGRLFLDDGEEAPVLENGRVEFSLVPEEESPRFYVFRARRRVLPAENYRIKLTNAGELRWRSFALPPLRETRQGFPVLPGRAADGFGVTAEFLGIQAQPLELEFTARDVLSGRRIEDGVTVAVRRNSVWVPLTAAVQAELHSGAVHQLRFEHPEYHPQVFRLAVRPEEIRLHLDIGLHSRSE